MKALDPQRLRMVLCLFLAVLLLEIVSFVQAPRMHHLFIVEGL